MKTLAISTLGWSEEFRDSFEQYVHDVADDFYTNVNVIYTADHYFEIDIEEGDTAIEYLILRGTE